MAFRSRLAVLVYAAAFFAYGIATIAVEGAQPGWLGEVLANLRFHLVVAGAVLALAALIFAHRAIARLVLALLAASLALLHMVPLLPYIAAGPPQALQPSPNAVKLRVLEANLHSWAVDLVALERLLRESQADIVVLTEITPTQQGVYKAVTDIYPEQFQTPYGSDNTFTLRILARWPMDIVVRQPTEFDYSVLQARICLAGGKCLSILSAHAPRAGPDSRSIRNRVLQEIADQARAAANRGEGSIAVGDFNITAFSPDFAIFGAAGLTDSALGRGYPSTWPFVLPGMGVGIDHVLVSLGIGVAGVWLGPDIHSDHFPLFVELAVRE